MIQTTASRRMLLIAAILLTGVFTSGIAQAADRNYSGTLKEKLKVSGCGSDTANHRFSINLKSNRFWNADNFGGRYKSTSSGRKLNLSFNSTSKTLFRLGIRNWAINLCRANVKDFKDFKFKFKAKLNKKRTAMAGTVNISAKGRLKSRSVNTKYTGKIKVSR